jgi:hypothetical protein
MHCWAASDDTWCVNYGKGAITSSMFTLLTHLPVDCVYIHTYMTLLIYMPLAKEHGEVINLLSYTSVIELTLFNLFVFFYIIPMKFFIVFNLNKGSFTIISLLQLITVMSDSTRNTIKILYVDMSLHYTCYLSCI